MIQTKIDPPFTVSLLLYTDASTPFERYLASEKHTFWYKAYTLHRRPPKFFLWNQTCPTVKRQLRSSSSRQPTPGQQEWYRVFKPEFDTAAHDPLDLVKRYHEGVFVETNPVNNKGMLFHVTGNIIAASGMRYDEGQLCAS